jgi:hypothetical protein
MTRPSDTPGGETPGGKRCCSPSLHRGTLGALAVAVFADDLLKGESPEGLAYTVTCAACVLTTVCSSCGEVVQLRVNAPEW